MKKEKKIAGLRNGKILDSYWRGVYDKQASKAPSPPRNNPHRQAYINGYNEY